MKFLRNLLAAVLGSFIALGLLFLLAIGMLGALMPAEETVSVAPSSILRIDLASSIGEQTVSDPLDLSSIVPYTSSSESVGILDAVRAIDYAATDPAIKFIYLTNCGHTSGLAYMEELRSALERFRTSGKPVIAYGDNFSFGGYYLASVADKIYADEFASNNILGMATTIIFLKDILDRFGVEMQLIRHGKYKSAGEQFIASDISAANREQNQAMVDALWQAAAGSICKSRGITLSDLDRMVNNLELNTAQDMIDAGLVDELLTVNGMEQELVTLSGADGIKNVKMISLDKYIKARIKTDYKTKDKTVAFPITEVVTANEFFDYDAKYNGQVQEITPARISDQLAERVKKLTLAIYDILGCKGIIRVDYIISEGEVINMLEVNTTPGMTPTSFIPQQVRAAGLEMKDVLTDIIEN